MKTFTYIFIIFHFVTFNLCASEANFTYSVSGFDNICEGECGTSDLLLNFFGGTAPYNFTLSVNGVSTGPISTISFSNNFQVCADLEAGTFEFFGNEIRINPDFVPTAVIQITDVSDAMNCVGTSAGNIATFNTVSLPINNAPSEFMFTTNNNFIDLTMMESEIGTTNVNYYSDANLFTQIFSPHIYDYAFGGNTVWVQVFDGFCFSEARPVELFIDFISQSHQLSSDFKLFPIPSQEILNIRSDFDIHEYKIYNYEGELILFSNETQTKNQVNLSSLGAGQYYFWCIDPKGKVYAEPFIKI